MGEMCFSGTGTQVGGEIIYTAVQEDHGCHQAGFACDAVFVHLFLLPLLLAVSLCLIRHGLSTRAYQYLFASSICSSEFKCLHNPIFSGRAGVTECVNSSPSCVSYYILLSFTSLVEHVSRFCPKHHVLNGWGHIAARL
jgi:hypothetical protein